MRKNLLLLAFIILPLQMDAQTAAVKNIIKKYDPKCLRDKSSFESPAEFWHLIVTNDSRGKAIQKAVDKEENSMKDAIIALGYAMENQEYDFTTSDYDNVIEYLIKDLGIEKLANQKPIKVIRDDDVNASMDPTGQMRIYRGCLEKLSYKEILAVCAHEMAHCVCSHVLSKFWKSAKKEKRNKMWADIGASLFIGTIAATSGYAGYYGQDVSHFNNIIANADAIYNRSYDYADDATIRYTFRYSRDEESEADIIAYRFMEKMGYGGEHLLSMLKKLKELYGDTPTGKYDGHPSTTFRIQVISALMSGYSGK